MDRDEQVGLHAPRLAHALVQRHEEVGVARQHRAHAGQRVEAVAQLQRDREHHVLLAQAAGADGARVLAAVAGVERDDDQAVDLASLRACWAAASGAGAGRSGADAGCRGGAAPAPAALDAADELAQRILHAPARRACRHASLSRISASSGSRSCSRVQVEHQPVPVGRHRLQRELLRPHRLLQVDHQAHHARLVLADAHAGDERVVGAHLADQLAQRRAELEAVDVDHQARRVVGQ